MEAIILAARNSAHPELEARVGTQKASGGYVPGVSAAVHDSICDILNTFGKWKQTYEHSRHDFFYPQGRLSVKPSDQQPHCVAKVNRAVYDTNLKHFHVRVACASEMPVDADSLGNEPTFVRVKHTRSWKTDSGWRYDLSRVTTGASLSEAQQRRSTNQLTYEFEIELEDVDAYLLRHSDAYTAASLQMKLEDILEAVQRPPDESHYGGGGGA